MAFKNEKISEQDRAKFDAVINYENLRKHARYISRFPPNSHLWWTLDRERDTYVIRVVGGGREQLDYYALVIEGQPVVFNVDDKWEGNDNVGIQAHWNVYDLCIPTELKPRRQEIKQGRKAERIAVPPYGYNWIGGSPKGIRPTVLPRFLELTGGYL